MVLLRTGRCVFLCNKILASVDRTVTHYIQYSGSATLWSTGITTSSRTVHTFSLYNCGLKTSGLHVTSNLLTDASDDVNRAQPRRYAGHSKWQNIKATKTAKDAQKQKDTNNILKYVRVAARDGTDPQFNAQLRRMMERATALNIPKATVLNALKSAEQANKDRKAGVFEARGPFNSLLMIEVFTSRMNATRNNLQHMLKKYGGTLNVSGASHSFEHKGIVEASVEVNAEDTASTPKTVFNLEKAEEVAIEVGAEEVTVSKDDADGKDVYEFICDTTELANVRNGAQEHGMNVINAYLGYRPLNSVDVPADQVDIISQMFEELEANDEIVKIYDNFKLPESAVS